MHIINYDFTKYYKIPSKSQEVRIMAFYNYLGEVNTKLSCFETWKFSIWKYKTGVFHIKQLQYHKIMKYNTTTKLNIAVVRSNIARK